MDQENFWLNNPSVLFNKNSWYKIIPKNSMSINGVLNAITRFCILIIILFIIFCCKNKCIWIPIIVIIIIIIFYFMQKNEKIPHEEFNIQNGDSKKINSNKNKEENLAENITIADLIDIYNKPIYSQREFYSVPGSSLGTALNDQTGFAEWAYQPPKSCKENTAYCLKYEDIRFNKYNPNIS